MRLLPAILLAACSLPTSLPFFKSSEPDPGPLGDPQKAAVRAALQRYYPRLVRSGTGSRTVLFVTTTTGQVERTDLVWNAPPDPDVDLLFRRFADLRRDSLVNTGVTIFEPGEIGPARLIVVWGEKRAAGKRTGPYRFSGSER